MGTLEGNKDRAVQLLQNKLTLTKQEVFFKSFGIAIPSSKYSWNWQRENFNGRYEDYDWQFH